MYPSCYRQLDEGKKTLMQGESSKCKRPDNQPNQRKRRNIIMRVRGEECDEDEGDKENEEESWESMEGTVTSKSVNMFWTCPVFDK